MIKPSKVLIHAPDLSTLGGKQSYFAALKDHLGAEADFFTYGAKGKKESKAATISRLVGDYRRFDQQLASGKYGLVHLNPSMNKKSFFRDALFCWLAIRRGIKVLVFWHGWNRDFEKQAFGKFRGLFNRTYARADGMIILATEFEKKLVAQSIDMPLYRETTVIDDYLIEGLEEEEVLNRHHQPDEIRLLFLARVEKAKGIYEAIDAYGRLKTHFPQLKLTIAGSGSESQNVEDYIQSQAYQDIDVLGFINGPDKTKAFHQSHIYLFPSTYGEGLPCSVLEAMGCGLPVITTPNAGIKDFFKDGEMGYFLKTVDAASLARQIERLVQDEALRSQIAQFNFHYAQDHFRAAIVADRVKSIYADVQELLVPAV